MRVKLTFTTWPVTVYYVSSDGGTIFWGSSSNITTVFKTNEAVNLRKINRDIARDFCHKIVVKHQIPR